MTTTTKIRTQPSWGNHHNHDDSDSSMSDCGGVGGGGYLTVSMLLGDNNNKNNTKGKGTTATAEVQDDLNASKLLNESLSRWMAIHDDSKEEDKDDDESDDEIKHYDDSKKHDDDIDLSIKNSIAISIVATTAVGTTATSSCVPKVRERSRYASPPKRRGYRRSYLTSNDDSTIHHDQQKNDPKVSGLRRTKSMDQDELRHYLDPRKSTPTNQPPDTGPLVSSSSVSATESAQSTNTTETTTTNTISPRKHKSPTRRRLPRRSKSFDESINGGSSMLLPLVGQQNHDSILLSTTKATKAMITSELIRNGESVRSILHVQDDDDNDDDVDHNTDTAPASTKDTSILSTNISTINVVPSSRVVNPYHSNNNNKSDSDDDHSTSTEESGFRSVDMNLNIDDYDNDSSNHSVSIENDIPTEDHPSMDVPVSIVNDLKATNDDVNNVNENDDPSDHTEESGFRSVDVVDMIDHFMSDDDQEKDNEVGKDTENDIVHQECIHPLKGVITDTPTTIMVNKNPVRRHTKIDPEHTDDDRDTMAYSDSSDNYLGSSIDTIFVRMKEQYGDRIVTMHPNDKLNNSNYLTDDSTATIITTITQPITTATVTATDNTVPETQNNSAQLEQSLRRWTSIRVTDEEKEYDDTNKKITASHATSDAPTEVAAVVRKPPTTSLSMRRNLIKRGESVRGLIVPGGNSNRSIGSLSSVPEQSIVSFDKDIVLPKSDMMNETNLIHDLEPISRNENIAPNAPIKFEKEAKSSMQTNTVAEMIHDESKTLSNVFDTNGSILAHSAPDLVEASMEEDNVPMKQKQSEGEPNGIPLFEQSAEESGFRSVNSIDILIDLAENECDNTVTSESSLPYNKEETTKLDVLEINTDATINTNTAPILESCCSTPLVDDKNTKESLESPVASDTNSIKNIERAQQSKDSNATVLEDNEGLQQKSLVRDNSLPRDEPSSPTKSRVSMMRRNLITRGKSVRGLSLISAKLQQSSSSFNFQPTDDINRKNGINTMQIDEQEGTAQVDRKLFDVINTLTSKHSGEIHIEINEDNTNPTQCGLRDENEKQKSADTASSNCFTAAALDDPSRPMSDEDSGTKRIVMYSQLSFDSRSRQHTRRAMYDRNLFPQKSLGREKPSNDPIPNKSVGTVLRRNLIKRGESVRGLGLISSKSMQLSCLVEEKSSKISDDECSIDTENSDLAKRSEEAIPPTAMRVNIEEKEPDQSKSALKDDTVVAKSETETPNCLARNDKHLIEQRLNRWIDVAGEQRPESVIEPDSTQLSFDSRSTNRITVDDKDNLVSQKTPARENSGGRSALAMRRNLIKRGESVRGLVVPAATPIRPVDSSSNDEGKNSETNVVFDETPSKSSYNKMTGIESGPEEPRQFHQDTSAYLQPKIENGKVSLTTGTDDHVSSSNDHGKSSSKDHCIANQYEKYRRKLLSNFVAADVNNDTEKPSLIRVIAPGGNASQQYNQDWLASIKSAIHGQGAKAIAPVNEDVAIRSTQLRSDSIDELPYVIEEDNTTTELSTHHDSGTVLTAFSDLLASVSKAADMLLFSDYSNPSQSNLNDLVTVGNLSQPFDFNYANDGDGEYPYYAKEVTSGVISGYDSVSEWGDDVYLETPIEVTKPISSRLIPSVVCQATPQSTPLSTMLNESEPEEKDPIKATITNQSTVMEAMLIDPSISTSSHRKFNTSNDIDKSTRSNRSLFSLPKLRRKTSEKSNAASHSLNGDSLIGSLPTSTSQLGSNVLSPTAKKQRRKLFASSSIADASHSYSKSTFPSPSAGRSTSMRLSLPISFRRNSSTTIITTNRRHSTHGIATSTFGTPESPNDSRTNCKNGVPSNRSGRKRPSLPSNQIPLSPSTKQTTVTSLQLEQEDKQHLDQVYSLLKTQDDIYFNLEPICSGFTFEKNDESTTLLEL